VEDTAPDRRSYETLLDDLANRLPNLTGPLRAAHASRLRTLLLYEKGVALQGLDLAGQLLVDAQQATRQATPPIGFLILRLRAALAGAIEAMLSSYINVSTNMMRDVSEVMLLLRHFKNEPASIMVWYNANDRERHRQFSPFKLREAHAQRLGVSQVALPEVRDYSVHSALLHVSTASLPGIVWGIPQSNQTGFATELAIWDIYAHMTPTLDALSDVLAAMGLKALSTANPPVWDRYLECSRRVSARNWYFETAAKAATGNKVERLDDETIELAFANASTISKAIEQILEVKKWTISEHDRTMYFEAIATSTKPGERLTVDTAIIKFVGRVKEGEEKPTSGIAGSDNRAAE
jgi:hypothetical protein